MIVLGLMSGTSLDGLDLALCRFYRAGKGYSYELIKAKTVNYPANWKKKLSQVQDASAEDYFALDAGYGEYIAGRIIAFLKGSVKPVAIASHGHTVFHQPERGFTTQIGSGATIAARTGITTVCDFRSLDVAGKGQGAPLVPIGDRLLFGSYDACLNIGGIANVSFEKKGKRIAYDICEANMLLNHLAAKCGREFDEGGKIAASGVVDKKLLARLNGFDYYTKKGARSLGREWFEKNILTLVEKSGLSPKDLLATASAHIAHTIASDLNRNALKNILVTGGGAFNVHLIRQIVDKTKCRIIVPSKEIINFKEALIFAFLGYLRLTNSINTLASVTGAKNNSIGGAVYLGA